MAFLKEQHNRPTGQFVDCYKTFIKAFMAYKIQDFIYFFQDETLFWQLVKMRIFLSNGAAFYVVLQYS